MTKKVGRKLKRGRSGIFYFKIGVKLLSWTIELREIDVGVVLCLWVDFDRESRPQGKGRFSFVRFTSIKLYMMNKNVILV